MTTPSKGEMTRWLLIQIERERARAEHDETCYLREEAADNAAMLIAILEKLTNG